MQETNPKADAFFAAATDWSEELRALRPILRDGPLTEEFKWRSPVYTFRGSNVAILWGFKEFCGLGFFKGVLLKDRARLMVAPGENSRSVRMFKFTGTAAIAAAEATLRDYIAEAVEIERAGLTVSFPKDDLTPPEELSERLARDPGLRAAFEALTPGRRRGYLLYFSQPKKSETRIARIDKAAARITAGKGLNDR